MTVILTLMVRDEADILQANLEHHLREGVDHVIVTDNGSVDGSRDLLIPFERSGVVTIIDEPGRDWRQGPWVTRMARLAAERFRDAWIINGDADEFFLSRSRPLNAMLASVPEDIGIILVSRNDFVPHHRPFTASPPVEMLHRKRISLNPLTNGPICPKAVHRAAVDIEVFHGCHRVCGGFQGEPIQQAELITFHYPIRSLEQFESKVRNAGSGYALNEELSPGIGDRMRHWYALLQEGRLADEYQRAFFHTEESLCNGVQTGDLVVEHLLRDRCLGGSGAGACGKVPPVA